MDISKASHWTTDRREGGVSHLDVVGRHPSVERSSPSSGGGLYDIACSPVEMMQRSGPAGSLESALARTNADSDDELEAIRGSVRSLRAQRLAVEHLKDKAREDARMAESLKVRLREAESRIRELEAQGGKEVVRRLMDEVSELRARLKATSAALQTREKSVVELREAIRVLEQDRRSEQASFRTQSLKLEDQEKELLEQQASIRRLEGARARLEEKASAAERRADEKCAKARRDVDSLSALLREAKTALGVSKGELETTVGNHIKTLDRARKDKEALLFERGQEQERLKELTVLCERQRSKLNEKGQDTKDLERALTSSKEATRLAEKQVSELHGSLSEVGERRKQEDLAAASKLRVISGRADELKAELLRAKADSEDKGHQLIKHRQEMTTFREDVKKLRELAAQQREVRQALTEKDKTIRALRERLELERRERGQWAQARTELLSQFCDEENKLRSTLQTGRRVEHRYHPEDPRQHVKNADEYVKADYIDLDHILPPPSSHDDRHHHHHHHHHRHKSYPERDLPPRPTSNNNKHDNSSNTSHDTTGSVRSRRDFTISVDGDDDGGGGDIDDGEANSSHEGSGGGGRGVSRRGAGAILASSRSHREIFTSIDDAVAAAGNGSESSLRSDTSSRVSKEEEKSEGSVSSVAFTRDIAHGQGRRRGRRKQADHRQLV